ncbi:MAG TPA: transglutaminase-like domain-containing protein, partial [Allocoleopsis sp.]
SPSPVKYSHITISNVFDGGKGLLKLPNGTFKIDNFPVLKMQRNQYGVVKLEGNSSLLSYEIYFNKTAQNDSIPTKEDLLVPEKEKRAIAQVIQELNLQNQSPEATLKILKDFFTNKFTYSTNLLGQEAKTTPLSTFLLKNRAGHCEYFASATALILRSLSIPTRYTVGFSVNEFSNLEKQYIVREKDAHAWNLVYINGNWQEFDTTPGEWSLIERKNASKLRIISDFLSLIGFKISGLWQQFERMQILKYWWVLIIPVILGLFWQFNKQKRVKRLKVEKNSPKSLNKNQKKETGSDFYLIEKRLNNLGFIRDNSESLKKWIERIKKEVQTADFLDELSGIIELYYGDRFDPEGIKESEKTRLKSAIQSWLEKW